MTAKDYLEQFGIRGEIIYDSADRPHDLECLLNDFAQEQANEPKARNESEEVCKTCMHFNKGEKLDICRRCFGNSHFDEQT